MHEKNYKNYLKINRIVMSNKNDTTYRDPLEDKGWAQMKALLDKEMPNRNRRMAWWYWAVASAVVALIGWIGYAQIQQQETKTLTLSDKNDTEATESFSEVGTLEHGKMIDQKEKESQTGASVSTTLLKAKDGGDHNKSPGDKPEKTRNALQSRNAEKLADQNSQKSINDTGLLVSETKLSQTEKNETVQEVDNSSENVPVYQIEPNPDFKGQKDKNVRTDLIADDGKKRNVGQLVYLSAPDFMVSYRPSISLSESLLMAVAAREDAAIEVPDGKKGFNFSLEAAVISEAQFSKLSVDGGAQVRYAFNDVLALGSGVYFWQISNTQQFAGTQSALGFQSQDMGDPQLVIEPELMDVTTGNVNNVRMLEVANADNLSYLRIPLYIQLFPHRKLQPRMGVNQLLLVSDNFPGAAEEQTDLNANPGAKAERLEDIVRQTNLSYEIGITFQPNDHLYLDLSYQRGQSSYLNYEVMSRTFQEYHRSWRLAAGFRF
jgi:hypothetical protein